MSTINSQPDSLSFSGNLKKFVITSSAEVIFILSRGATLILNEKYQPDSSNLLTIDVKPIIDRLLQIEIPEGSAQVTEQNAAVADFTASVDGQLVNFRVVKGGVSELSETAHDWLYAHLLTWQPREKLVLQTQPEWLGIYPVVNGNLTIKAYHAGGSYSAAYIYLAKNKLYSINVSWGAVSSWLASSPQSQTFSPLAWEFSFSVPGVGVVTPVHRYQLRYPGDAENIFVWANTLGGIDSVSFTGYSEEDLKLEHKNSLYEDETIFEYDIYNAREIRQSTGFLNDYEKRWIADFFYSRRKYVLRKEGTLKPIAVVNSKIISINSNDEFDLEFTYRFSEDDHLLNFDTDITSLKPPEGLSEFFLTALLSGLSQATYSGSLLLPVQSPYVEAWQKLSFNQLWASALPGLIDNSSIMYVNGKLSATGVGAIDAITWTAIQEYINIHVGGVTADTTTKIISGSIMWEGGFNYRSSNIVYKILGVQYVALAKPFTLTSAPISMSRIDIVYCDIFSNLWVAEGEPAENPSSPVLNASQIEISTILITPGATAPDGAESENIYDENTEWTATETHDTDITVDFASTDAPKNLTKRVKVALAIPGTQPNTPQHYVGEYYQGGRIFMLNADGTSGLIATETDCAIYVIWGSPGTTEATGVNVGQGSFNTALMLSSEFANAYVARFCNDLTIDGYSDWVLPSEAELSLMFDRRFDIGNFLPSPYWSSTELPEPDGIYLARAVDFFTGSVFSNFKDGSCNVRAIRAFSDSNLPGEGPVTDYTITGTSLTFTAPSPVEQANGTLFFYLKSSLGWYTNSTILIEIYLDAVKAGTVGISPSNNLLGYNPNLNTWQMVAIPIYNFMPSLQTFNKLKFTFSGTWPNLIDIGFDSILFQHGGVPDPDDVLVTPGTFGSATQTLELTVNAQGRVTAIVEHDIAEVSEAGILDDISFEFRDLTPGTSQVYDLDIKATYGYTIEGAVLETDNGTLTGVAVKIGATAVTALANLTVETTADETNSEGAKTVVVGNRVTLVTSVGYTGTPTLVKGKLIIRKMVNILIEAPTGTSTTVALVANVDKNYDTGSAVKPKFIQVFDAAGVVLGFERSFATTYWIKIFATDTTQDAELNIIY